MLALTDSELRQTDIADHAIEMLDAKGIKEIVVLGRRGLAQAAFTNPDIKELGVMEDADRDRPLERCCGTGTAGFEPATSTEFANRKNQARFRQSIYR